MSFIKYTIKGCIILLSKIKHFMILTSGLIEEKTNICTMTMVIQAGLRVKYPIPSPDFMPENSVNKREKSFNNLKKA
jgi:hypothetical protein